MLKQSLLCERLPASIPRTSAPNARAVLHSTKGYGLDALSDIFDRDSDTVSSWLKALREPCF